MKMKKNVVAVVVVVVSRREVQKGEVALGIDYRPFIILAGRQ